MYSFWATKTVNLYSIFICVNCFEPPQSQNECIIFFLYASYHYRILPILPNYILLPSCLTILLLCLTMSFSLLGLLGHSPILPNWVIIPSCLTRSFWRPAQLGHSLVLPYKAILPTCLTRSFSHSALLSYSPNLHNYVILPTCITMSFSQPA